MYGFGVVVRGAGVAGAVEWKMAVMGSEIVKHYDIRLG